MQKPVLVLKIFGVSKQGFTTEGSKKNQSGSNFNITLVVQGA